MEKPQYYSITVKKMNILTRHSDWLVKTQELYNQILEFYYNLYLDTFQDGKPGSMEALRTLEKLTIAGRDRQPVKYPLPWAKVPLYFRKCDHTENLDWRKMALESHQAPWQYHTGRRADDVTFYRPEKDRP